MTDDPVTSALKLALIYKTDPFAVMAQPTRVVAEVLARTTALLDELSSDDED